MKTIPSAALIIALCFYGQALATIAVTFGDVIKKVNDSEGSFFSLGNELQADYAVAYGNGSVYSKQLYFATAIARNETIIGSNFDSRQVSANSTVYLPSEYNSVAGVATEQGTYEASFHGGYFEGTEQHQMVYYSEYFYPGMGGM